MSDLITLADAVALATLEADLLDAAQFTQWLNLYTPEGLYIIPIDPDATDYREVLNYAYDNAEMREKRVERLCSGHSISAAPPARTVRMQGRFRLIEATATTATLRCAQFLVEHRHERERMYAANVIFDVARGADGTLRIARKVVTLINSTDALSAISYIL
ncbi:aromatic-ring-hydroxylating dioxygenase subunit beta [Komagataeibacter xylinus]|uniref:Aromatic-ring-hydroxylating dioxygenase subunit beta n=1 Tax=Komagataeibacter xylinus TaxID=28448 RepID=A0A857FPA0_KOMXY|nr:aromatic-ring-hydroxylating dioxygenase subunit beta [Komagataeibacter xylinus]QHC35995.1 hypothetical protein FMA36_11290 [Komagataeibacter xylinus]